MHALRIRCKRTVTVSTTTEKSSPPGETSAMKDGERATQVEKLGFQCDSVRSGGGVELKQYLSEAFAGGRTADALRYRQPT